MCDGVGYSTQTTRDHALDRSTIDVLVLGGRQAFDKGRASQLVSSRALGHSSIHVHVLMQSNSA